MPGRRGKPGGVGPVLRSSEEARRRRLQRPAHALRGCGYGGAVGSRTRPEQYCPAFAYERQAPLRRDRRLCQRLGDGEPVASRAAAPRRGPRSTASSVRSVHPSRGTRICGARPRAVSPRGAGSATASGIPGVPPPEPTSTIGAVLGGDELEPAKRIVEQYAARCSGSRSAVRPGVARRPRPASGRWTGDVASAACVSRRIAAAGRRRTGWARCPRSTSRSRDRP